MNAETQGVSDAAETPKRSKWRGILFFVASTCWIIKGYIPIIPLGAILGLIICRPKKLRTYTLVFVAAIMGFVGTGLHITFAKVKRTNIETGAEFFDRKMQSGIRLGTATIDYFLHKDKMVVYDDTSCQTEVDEANARVTAFVENYNANDLDSILDSVVYGQGVTRQQVQDVFTTARERGGPISSFKYLGYLAWVYPNQEHADITVVHTADFEKDCGWNSVHFRFVFFPEGPKLARIDFVEGKVKYRVVKGMKTTHPFLKKD